MCLYFYKDESEKFRNSFKRNKPKRFYKIYTLSSQNINNKINLNIGHLYEQYKSFSLDKNNFAVSDRKSLYPLDLNKPSEYENNRREINKGIHVYTSKKLALRKVNSSYCTKFVVEVYGYKNDFIAKSDQEAVFNRIKIPRINLIKATKTAVRRITTAEKHGLKVTKQSINKNLKKNRLLLLDLLSELKQLRYKIRDSEKSLKFLEEPIEVSLKF